MVYCSDNKGGGWGYFLCIICSIFFFLHWLYYQSVFTRPIWAKRMDSRVFSGGERTPGAMRRQNKRKKHDSFLVSPWSSHEGLSFVLCPWVASLGHGTCPSAGPVGGIPKGFRYQKDVTLLSQKSQVSGIQEKEMLLWLAWQNIRALKNYCLAVLSWSHVVRFLHEVMSCASFMK